METGLTIGKVAKRAGVNVQTLRYYERRKLLRPDTHKDSGYRLYGEEAVTRIRFIKNAQALGFTLAEISQLLNLRVRNIDQCGAVKKKAEAKLNDIGRKIGHLRAMEKTLLNLLRACRTRSKTDDCPILKSLETPGEK